MSKPWKPGRQTVELRPEQRPSRIRREPVRLQSAATVARTAVVSREREMVGGIAGILLFAVIIAVLVIGISIATIFHDDPASSGPAFGQCYNAGSNNCVLDGGTIYVGGEKIVLAGVAAPSIQDPQCAAEHDRGIAAAIQLADLLNSGKVTVSAPFRDSYGREVRSVEVKDRDVGQRLIDAELVRAYTGDKQDWCTGES